MTEPKRLWRCRGCSWNEPSPGPGVEEHEALSGHYVDMPGSTPERVTASIRLDGWDFMTRRPMLARGRYASTEQEER